MKFNKAKVFGENLSELARAASGDVVIKVRIPEVGSAFYPIEVFLEDGGFKLASPLPNLMCRFWNFQDVDSVRIEVNQE